MNGTLNSIQTEEMHSVITRCQCMVMRTYGNIIARTESCRILEGSLFLGHCVGKFWKWCIVPSKVIGNTVVFSTIKSCPTRERRYVS